MNDAWMNGIVPRLVRTRLSLCNDVHFHTYELHTHTDPRLRSYNTHDQAEVKLGQAGLHPQMLNFTSEGAAESPSAEKVDVGICMMAYALI